MLGKISLKVCSCVVDLYTDTVTNVLKCCYSETFFCVGRGKKNATKIFLSVSSLKQAGIYHARIGVEFQSPPEQFRETQLCTPGEL